jgi:hypothetical protein
MFSFISELPEVLIIQIARFGHRWFGLGKVHRMVSFPDENVDFSHFIPPDIDCGPCRFNLTAVIHHTGFMTGGHYECFARRENRWYLYNDDIVKEVSREDVLNCQGYLLFYTKIASVAVAEVRQSLPRRDSVFDEFLPIRIFSNPRTWIKSVPNQTYDLILSPAMVLAGEKVTRECNDDDLRAKFVSELPLSDDFLYIGDGARDMIWSFVTEKGAVPCLFDIANRDGVRAGNAVSMFYHDPELVNANRESEDGEEDKEEEEEEEEDEDEGGSDDSG